MLAPLVAGKGSFQCLWIKLAIAPRDLVVVDELIEDLRRFTELNSVLALASVRTVHEILDEVENLSDIARLDGVVEFPLDSLRRACLKLDDLGLAEVEILRNLSLLPVSGVYKSAFKMWLELDSLKNVNELIRICHFYNDH